MGRTDFHTRTDETVALGFTMHLKRHLPGFIQLAIDVQVKQTIALGGDAVERYHLDIDRAEYAQA